MKSIGEDIWLVDGAELEFLGFWRLPIRMVVVRMGTQLWAHSPVALDQEMVRRIDALGELRHIVAPNDYHHSASGPVD